MCDKNKSSNMPAEFEFETVKKMDYVEAWFDNHPNPAEIDCHLFTFGNVEMEIYFADMYFETWLIKLNCSNAQRALWLSKLFHKTTCQMNITQILIGKKLFLFTDKRF